MQNFINFYGVSPKADSTVYLANADGKVTWLDARDIGEVAAAVLSGRSHVGQAVTLTGGEALSTEEACAVLAKAFGHKVSYVAVPEEAARKAMEDRGMPAWMVKGFLELAWIIRQGWSAAIAPGVQDVLGRAPRTLAQYAADVAAARV